MGDDLREWMRKNRDRPLAAAIQDKLDNQGFLGSQELNPFIREAIAVAVKNPEQKIRGILIDGYPRCMEQLNSFDLWPFEDALPRHHSDDISHSRAPDMVIAIRVRKANARARYVGRMRDARDSVEKFEKRFVEYETETLPVEDVYRKRGLLVEVNANGTEEESIAELEQQLKKSPIWNRVSIGANMKEELIPSKTPECTDGPQAGLP